MEIGDGAYLTGNGIYAWSWTPWALFDEEFSFLDQTIRSVGWNQVHDQAHISAVFRHGQGQDNKESVNLTDQV